MQTPAIEMKGITKIYPNGVVANKDVDFSVDYGEIHAVMGENGAGKSTLMKMLFGLEKIDKGEIIKGDVLSVAQVGGIMGAKKTSDIIPMCHSIMMSGCDITFQLDYEKSKVDIIATTKTIGETGIEMEALTAASIAALTIYDMCKSVDKSMVISDIRLLRKIGGKSGEINYF